MRHLLKWNQGIKKCHPEDPDRSLKMKQRGNDKHVISQYKSKHIQKPIFMACNARQFLLEMVQ